MKTTINNEVVATVADKIAVMVSGDSTKVTFNLFTKKIGEEYQCIARVTDKAEQMEVAFKISATSEEQPIEFTVGASRFCEVVKTLVKYKEDLIMALEESTLTLVVADTASLSMPCMEADEKSSFSNEGATSIQVETKAFTSILRKGGIASDKSSSNEAMRSAILKCSFDSKELNCLSTNGHIVASSKCEALTVQTKAKGKSIKVGIPQTCVGKILRLATSSKLNIMITDTQAVVAAGTTMYQFGLAAKILDVETILQQWEAAETDAGATMDNERILVSIGTIECGDKDQACYCFDVEGDKIKLSTPNDEQKAMIAPVKIKGSLNVEGFGITKDYLRKVVESLDKGNVTIRTNTMDKNFPYILQNGTLDELSDKSICYVMKRGRK